MIEAMTVVTVKESVDRSGYDANKVKSFERITGIKHTKRTDESVLRMSLPAISDVLKKTKHIPIEAVIFITQSPDRLSPAHAVSVLEYFALPNNIPAFDVNQSCCAFIYGLFLASTLNKNTLLVCADKLRPDAGDLDNLLFSDGATAAVVTPQGFSEFQFLNDPTGALELFSTKEGRLVINGGAVFDFTTENIPQFIQRYYHQSSPPQVLVQHQANLTMMKMIHKRSGFPGQSLTSIEQLGNMSMCSIPSAIALNEEQILNKRMLLCGYGAGWSAAQVEVTWPGKPITNIIEI